MCTGCAALSGSPARGGSSMSITWFNGRSQARARLAAAAITTAAAAARVGELLLEEAIHPRLVLARAAVLPLRAGGGRVRRVDHERARQHPERPAVPRSPWTNCTLFLPYPSKRSSKLGVAFARTTGIAYLAVSKHVRQRARAAPVSVGCWPGTMPREPSARGFAFADLDGARDGEDPRLADRVGGVQARQRGADAPARWCHARRFARNRQRWRWRRRRRRRRCGFKPPRSRLRCRHKPRGDAVRDRAGGAPVHDVPH